MFRHFPLGDPQASIRLIEIQPGRSTQPISCSIRHTSLVDADFVALSYKWSSSANPKKPHLKQARLRVTKNLHSFLTAGRKKRATVSFWIDAICIDQDNISERSEQVKLMGRIYSSANEVWVWLGSFLASSTSVSELFDLSQPARVRELSVRARVKIQNCRQAGNEVWHQTLRKILFRSY